MNGVSPALGTPEGNFRIARYSDEDIANILDKDCYIIRPSFQNKCGSDCQTMLFCDISPMYWIRENMSCRLLECILSLENVLFHIRCDATVEKIIKQLWPISEEDIQNCQPLTPDFFLGQALSKTTSLEVTNLNVYLK